MTDETSAPAPNGHPRANADRMRVIANALAVGADGASFAGELHRRVQQQHWRVGLLTHYLAKMAHRLDVPWSEDVEAHDGAVEEVGEAILYRLEALRGATGPDDGADILTALRAIVSGASQGEGVDTVDRIPVEMIRSAAAEIERLRSETGTSVRRVRCQCCLDTIGLTVDGVLSTHPIPGYAGIDEPGCPGSGSTTFEPLS